MEGLVWGVDKIQAHRVLIWNSWRVNENLLKWKVRAHEKVVLWPPHAHCGMGAPTPPRHTPYIHTDIRNNKFKNEVHYFLAHWQPSSYHHTNHTGNINTHWEGWWQRRPIVGNPHQNVLSPWASPHPRFVPRDAQCLCEMPASGKQRLCILSVRSHKKLIKHWDQPLSHEKSRHFIVA